MHSARRPLPFLSLALVFALLVGMLPAVAMASSVAPIVAQADDAADAPLVYVSDLLPAASGPGRLITLELDVDGTATWSTNFLNGEAPIVETGSWGVADDGTVEVSITGNDEGPYDEPVDVVFAEDADGVWSAVEWDEAIFGSEGLLLYPAQNPELAGLYLSETLPAASSPGREISVELAYDGTATWSTDFLNGEAPIVELGSWSADTEGTEVAVTLTGRADRAYDTPVDWLFAVEDDGSLTAIEWDETTSGSDVLVLFPADDAMAEASSPAGVWVSDILPAASSPGQVVLLILYDDGSLQSSTWYLNGEDPIIEVGDWSDNGDGSVTVTVTGTNERTYDAAQELAFDYDGDVLTYLSLTLNRVPAAGSAPAAEPVAIYASDTLPAASSPGREISLVLYDDGSAQMITDFLNGEEPIVELGEWVDNGDDTLTLTLTGREDRTYDEPEVIVFALADGTLTATEWDETTYGAEGLTLTEQDLDAMMDEMMTDEASAEAVDETPVLTAPETPAVEEPVVEESAVEEPAAGEGTALEIPPFDVPAGAVTVYTSGLQPSASSPGRVSYLVLFDDGSSQMVTDYLNGEEPIIEIGTWEETDGGELVVTLLGPITGLYAEPVVTTYTVSDGTLTALEWDEAIYGAEPPTMTLYEPAAQ